MKFVKTVRFGRGVGGFYDRGATPVVIAAFRPLGRAALLYLTPKFDLEKYFVKNGKTSAVSTTDGVVETQLFQAA